eukprot:00889.XXX_732_890_1 [CDS] Oithona nana genome sequencing.
MGMLLTVSTTTLEQPMRAVESDPLGASAMTDTVATEELLVIGTCMTTLGLLH